VHNSEERIAISHREMKDLARIHATPCGACGGLDYKGKLAFFLLSIIPSLLQNFISFN